MKTSLETSNNLHFLAGGGEMGKLTRQFNWLNHPLGHPETWPQSLRLTLSMILSSKFPMFLWWGEELFQFYNDAYRPSLGKEGKHPKALGQKGKDCWPEIWETIYPLIRQVREEGKSTWSEDQLIPIYRNGKLEDVYWTFGYSPIFGEGESRKVAGVLVICTETTEKVQSRMAIEKSDQLFKTMADASDVLISVADNKLNSTYFSKAWVELTGRSQEELLELGWSDFLQPDDREVFIRNYRQALSRGVSFEGEFRILDINGNYRWLLAKVPAIYNPDGSHVGYISSCIDITEIKEAENSLKSSEARLRSVVDSAPFPIGVYVGRELKIELANRSILDIWGKGYDVIGKFYKEVLPELENQEIFQQLDQVLSTGIPFHKFNQRVDLVVQNKIKAYYFNYSFIPLFDASGQVYGVMNTAADVTDLNLAKLKVQESERNLRQTILNAPVAMCLLKGPNHVVELANKLMIELWGKKPMDVLGKPIMGGLPEARDQGFEARLEGVYSTGNSFIAEGVPLSLPRNGKNETLFVNFLYEPHREAGGNITGIFAVAVDVTAQVQARHSIEEVVATRTQELANAVSDLKKSNAELAQFAYIASHDLQEPLRKISIFTQMLRNKAGENLNEQAKLYLNKIQTSSNRMTSLIREVLTYSELVNEKDMFKEVDLNATLALVISDFELMIEEKAADVQVQKLPVIEAIPLQMSQLFGNLISNSLKFAKKDNSPLITISASPITQDDKSSLSLESSLDFIKIEFRDNGIGFKEEHKDRIFKIFQRLHGKLDYEGTGIGLAMCKKIALNHQGNINAVGSTQEGAIFNVYLPIRQRAGS